MTTVAASMAHMAKLGFVRRTKNGNATSKTVDGMDMDHGCNLAGVVGRRNIPGNKKKKRKISP